MKFNLIIDPSAKESVTVVAHKPSRLTDALKRLLEESYDCIIGYRENESRVLSAYEIECVFLEGGRTYASLIGGDVYHLKARLYELEEMLPDRFIRLNKSSIGALDAIEKFKSTITGAVDAVFRSGHVEYVSRRCFTQIKRRLGV